MINQSFEKQHFSDRMNKTGERNPLNGQFEVEISGRLASDTRVARSILASAVREIECLFAGLPRGEYHFQAVTGTASDQHSSFNIPRLALNSQSLLTESASSLAQEGLAHLGKELTRIMAPIFSDKPSLGVTASELNVKWIAHENEANTELSKASSGKIIVANVKDFLNRSAWFSPEILVESLNRINPVSSSTLLELIHVLGPGMNYDKTTHDRFSWRCKVALLPNIIEAGLLDPDKPWADRDHLLDQYLPLVELRQHLNSRISKRSAEFASALDMTIDCLIANEMDQSRDPVSIHLNDNSEQHHFDRAKTLRSLQEKYNLQTFSDIVISANQGLIPQNVIEILIESDLISFEFRKAMLEACPALQQVCDEAQVRHDAIHAEKMADISFMIAQCDS